MLVANATTINKLTRKFAIYWYRCMSDEELAKGIKVKRVVTNDRLADDEMAIFFRNYGTIGTSSPSTIEDYEITTNTDLV